MRHLGNCIYCRNSEMFDVSCLSINCIRKSIFIGYVNKHRSNYDTFSLIFGFVLIILLLILRFYFMEI